MTASALMPKSEVGKRHNNSGEKANTECRYAMMNSFSMSKKVTRAATSYTASIGRRVPDPSRRCWEC